MPKSIDGTSSGNYGNSSLSVVIHDSSPRSKKRHFFADDFCLDQQQQHPNYRPTSSDDSGISPFDVAKIQSIARLTEELNRDNFTTPTTSDRKKQDPENNGFRPRNLTATGSDRLFAKSLPGTPRRSIDVSYLNYNQNASPQNYWSKRRGSNAAEIRNPGSFSSIGDLENKEENQKNVFMNSLTTMFSCIYAVLVVVMGCVFYASSQNQHGENTVSEVFNILIVILGISWLTFLHIDLHRYKSSVLKMLKEHEESMDNISTTTEAVCNQSWLPDNVQAAYFFLRGRHSGSFYLKAGMAVFCFGHLINKGLVLGEQIVYLMDKEKSKMNCAHEVGVILNSLRPIFSFYQLFIIFKYSNIIINRFKTLARFGLMHLIACCLCFWFNTIVEDAVNHYQHSLTESTTNNNETQLSSNNTEKPFSCSSGTIFSSDNFKAIPYLYPFTIEYNIILAGVWFIVWQNIGSEHGRADPHHFERKVSVFDAEVTYQSNLVISADCHSANKGLFVGLFFMLTTIVTVIVFFIAISHDNYKTLGVYMYTIQEMVLCVTALVGILLAYKQLIKMDINQHPVTFLDDVLLFIPLPFFFVSSILSAMAEYHTGNYLRVVGQVLISLQVIVQTPCLIDGLRRCSNSQSIRYKKPGREVITFLIILNLSFWIVNTFEQKNVEPYLGQASYYGDTVSVFIGHTTHPLMLFYRFHSSVCLADIWKSAYEKGE